MEVWSLDENNGDGMSTQAEGSSAPRQASRQDTGTQDRRQEDDKPDWKWQLARGLLIYLAIQAVIGPNGLVAWWQGKTQFQQQQGASQNTEASHIPTRPVHQPVAAPPSKLAKGVSSRPLYTQDTPLDFYVFLLSGPEPTSDDVASQQSSLVRNQASPLTINFDVHGKDFAALLSSTPSQESVQDVQYWYPDRPTGQKEEVLGAIRWSGVTLNDYKLQRDAEVNIRVPEHVKTSNGSVWAEIFVSSVGMSLDDPQTLHMRKCERLLAIQCIQY